MTQGRNGRYWPDRWRVSRLWAGVAYFHCFEYSHRYFIAENQAIMLLCIEHEMWISCRCNEPARIGTIDYQPVNVYCWLKWFFSSNALVRPKWLPVQKLIGPSTQLSIVNVPKMSQLVIREFFTFWMLRTRNRRASASADICLWQFCSWLVWGAMQVSPGIGWI